MWIILAFLCAFCQACRAIFFKKLSQELDIYLSCGGRYICVLPFVLICVIIQGVPDLKDEFWSTAFIAAITVTISNLFLAYALKEIKHTSFAIALWKLSIIFLLAIEIISIGKIPSFVNICSVLIITIGVYTLKIGNEKKHLLHPFIEITRDKAMQIALLSAFFAAPACLYFKKTTELSNAFFSTLVIFLIASIILIPLIWKKSKNNFVLIPTQKYSFFWVGLFAAASTTLQNAAYVIAPMATFVEAIKQSEVLFLLVIDYFIAHKTGTKKPRLIGYIFLIGGTLLLIFTK